MTLRRLRPLALALVLALTLVLPAVGSAGAAEVSTDRGVVQSVGASQITLRGLDGSVVSFAVSATTRVKVNGVRRTLADVKPGFIASVVHRGSAPASVIRAFGTVPVLTDRGLVVSATRAALTLRRADGVTITVQLDAGTRFQLRGQPGRFALVRPGASVAVRHTDGGPAKVVNVLKRAGA